MTGESLPVEKYANLANSANSVLDAANLLFMGTNVVSGTATAMVLATDSFCAVDSRGPDARDAAHDRQLDAG